MNTRFAGRHSKANPDWYTPTAIVDAARRVFKGRIDCDPATDGTANKLIKATRIYTARTSGLATSARWRGNVFLNPPGGQVAAFWDRLIGEWSLGRTKAAIWIGYSLEQLQTLQSVRKVRRDLIPLNFTICYPKKRLAFIENQAMRRARLAKIDKENRARRKRGEKLLSRTRAKSPSHANYIVFVEPSNPSKTMEYIDRFAAEFQVFGTVVIPDRIVR